jgi:hypothetical protein
VVAMRETHSRQSIGQTTPESGQHNTLPDITIPREPL